MAITAVNNASDPIVQQAHLLLESASLLHLHTWGSYMVRPVLQDKITSDRERLLPYIRPLYEVVYTSGPDGIRAYPSHQVFGF